MAMRLLFPAVLAVVVQASDYNILNLDNHTLPLVLGTGLPAFVRFDKDYAYGDKADAYKALAASAVGAKVVIGTVGISTYGEKMNQDLAEKYGYKKPGKDLEYSDMDKDFPKFRFFPADGGKDVDYTGDVTADAMRMFLKTEAKGYFGLQGAIREFDKLAAEFVKASDKAEVLTRAKAAAEGVSADTKDSAAYYVKAMSKTHETGKNWYQSEYDRLKQMISGQITPKKKDEIQLKLNRLSAFVAPNFDL